MNNFLIVGTQRTGSSALASGISLHPNVVCGWEWTCRSLPWRAIHIAEAGFAGKFDSLTKTDQRHMERSGVSESTILGFRKLFRSSNKWLINPKLAPALLLDRLEAHIRWLHIRSDVRVIHIVREDNLAWLKSKGLSRESRIYVGKAYPEDLVVRVDINEALKRIASKHYVDTRLATLKQSNPYLRVCYENFRKDNKTVLLEALQFLGMDITQIRSIDDWMRARKPQSNTNTQERVANFCELESALSRHGLLYSNIA
jgi:hypothetical protein